MGENKKMVIHRGPGKSPSLGLAEKTYLKGGVVILGGRNKKTKHKKGRRTEGMQAREKALPQAVPWTALVGARGL